MEFREGGVATGPALRDVDPHEAFGMRARGFLSYAQIGVSAGALVSFGGHIAGLATTWQQAAAVSCCVMAILLKLVGEAR